MTDFRASGSAPPPYDRGQGAGRSAVVDASGLQNREDAGSNPVVPPPFGSVAARFAGGRGQGRRVPYSFGRSTSSTSGEVSAARRALSLKPVPLKQRSFVRLVS